jgi:ABC-type cobalamin/Fe3+-siderophores transport system ATPase subunit
VSLVDASERLVALSKDESLAESASEDVIVVEGLRMRYGATEAVAGINLRVARGEIFAFLGPNGAGKDDDGRDPRGLSRAETMTRVQV